MLSHYIAGALSLLAATVSAGTPVSVTPHEQYSSSIGVLGCKINTNRVAYWPSFPDCGQSMCVKVSANGREVHLLHIDQSGGAYDISYDAWNYLSTGRNATEDPTYGGGLAAEYDAVPMDECADLISTPGSRLPLMAANSINYVVGCPAGTWVGDHHALFNVQNSACTLGFNEECTLDLAVSNQPSCPHQLGLQNPLAGQPVYDVQYGTGLEVLVTQ